MKYEMEHVFTTQTQARVRERTTQPPKSEPKRLHIKIVVYETVFRRVSAQLEC